MKDYKTEINDLNYYELQHVNEKIERHAHRIRTLKRQVARKRKHGSPKRVSMNVLKEDLEANQEALNNAKGRKQEILNKIEKNDSKT